MSHAIANPSPTSTAAPCGPGIVVGIDPGLRRGSPATTLPDAQLRDPRVGPGDPISYGVKPMRGAAGRPVLQGRTVYAQPSEPSAIALGASKNTVFSM